MDELLPEFLIIIDLVGFGLTFWLGLHLMTHAWGWQRKRARMAALALWSLTFTFGLATYDGFSPVSGASLKGSTLRLLLWPLPLAWYLLARQLVPGVLRPRSRPALLLLLFLALLTLGINLTTSYLRPELLGISFYYLPAYLLTLLLSASITISLLLRSRRIVGSTLERRAMLFMAVASIFLLAGGTLLATDFVFGLSFPLFRMSPATALQARLAGSGSLLLASSVLALVILLRARADGAAHLSNFYHSLLVTSVMTLLYLAAGGFAVWYWELPQILLGLFLLLALLTDWLDNATRARLERWLYRGTAGTLRHNLRVAADKVESFGKVPPAVRPLLSRLARQLNAPQLGLALREDKTYRVVVALHPSWEGESVDVRDATVWEERGMSGWNMPLRHNGQTIGVIASEQQGRLSEIQRKLLEDAASEIVQLLSEWQTLAAKQEQLQKMVEEYRNHVETVEQHFAALGAPATRGRDLRRQVSQLLRDYNGPASKIGNLPIAKLKLIEHILPAGQKGEESRAQTVRGLMANLVEQLRPLEGEPPTVPTPEWYPYLVVNRLHLQGEPEEEFLIRTKMSRQQLKQARKRAVEIIARALAELEAGVLRRERQREAAARPATQPISRPSTAPAPTQPATATPGGAYGSSSRPGGTTPAGQPGPSSPAVARPQSAYPGRSQPTPATQPAPSQPAGTPAGTSSPTDPPKRSPLTALTGHFRRDDKPSPVPGAGSSPAGRSGATTPGSPAQRPAGAAKKGRLAATLAGLTNRFSSRKEGKKEQAGEKHPGGVSPLFGWRKEEQGPSSPGTSTPPTTAPAPRASATPGSATGPISSEGGPSAPSNHSSTASPSHVSAPPGQPGGEAGRAVTSTPGSPASSSPSRETGAPPMTYARSNTQPVPKPSEREQSPPQSAADEAQHSEGQGTRS